MDLPYGQLVRIGELLQAYQMATRFILNIVGTRDRLFRGCRALCPSALAHEGISQSDIARVCKVTLGHVHRVILGMWISHPVQSVIAEAIEQPVEKVFPKRYAPKGNAAKLAHLSQVNREVRMAG